MELLIVFLPLIGFLIAGLFGPYIGTKASEYITSTLVSISAVLSWILFFQIGMDHHGEAYKVTVLPWMHIGDLQVDWALRIDTLTCVMLVVVNSVSALVHIYSRGYMADDPSKPRFFAYLSLFTFAMLMLVTSDNLAQMFFGWEGVGLASYLLIGYYYKKPSANAAAMKAFIVNRVGDFGFALGIFALFAYFGSINLDVIFAEIGSAEGAVITLAGYEFDFITFTCILLFMGAMGKSAQLGLHTWLPDAMEGPTPVSALIHAATMVTAGVFMVARLSPIFEYSETAQTFIIIVGASTAFFAATVGLVQNDIKRVIAYSTCSQLGYMFVAIGVGGYAIAIFHLFTHAFFKALLFLGAGSVIHAMHHEQDMRHMGGLYRGIPVTYAMMIIGTLALTGFPYTAGYFSKDSVIEAAWVSQNVAGQFGFWMTVIAALFTSFYSWRLIFLTFHGRTRADAEVLSHAHESPMVMLVPLFLLAIGALFAGYVFYEYFVHHHYADFWKGAIFTLPTNTIIEDFHDVPKLVKYSPLIMMTLGFVTALYFYILSPQTPVRLAREQEPLYKFLLNKWYFDEIYDVLFVRPAKGLGRFLWKKGDGWLIDGFGPDGVASRVRDVTARVVRLQTGYVYHYAFVMLVGVALFITWFLFYRGA